jgi:putative endopeptidase
VKLNGRLTLGENTADNGGLRLAYLALLADAKQKSTDMNAKDSNRFNAVQQFFVAYGQSWCGTYLPAGAAASDGAN